MGSVSGPLAAAVAAAAVLLTGGCSSTPRPNGDAAGWPAVRSRVAHDSAAEARIDAVLAEMSLEEKVGQIIQPDISSITPEEVRRYKFGSILAGGNSSPGGKETAPAGEWLKLADLFWEASRAADWKGSNIPLMWGIDAVHGHANIVGATIFPQNIGLGAMRDPELIRRIGEVTAREMVATGLDWDFSPTLAVVRDDRWGRTYEGFSEDPEIVRAYAGRMVEGLQGRPGTREFMGPGRVIATAKHFVGDGGTAGGKDQGDTPNSPERLRDIHGAGYPPAIEAGVQAVMASFSSVRGEKVHGDRDLLTGALKTGMGFDGLVVGDWNAHGQVPGCTNISCPASINAGLDMFMAPDSWKGLYESTLAQARSGEIPIERLDDAVRRILRVKLRAGLFDKPKPSARPLAGRFDLLGSTAHRAVAREAVRKSLVLLKNAGGLLPLSPSANVLVAGDGADNISQAGRRLDDHLAGQRRHQRQFSQRPVDLRGDPASRGGGRRAGDAQRRRPLHGPAGRGDRRLRRGALCRVRRRPAERRIQPGRQEGSRAASAPEAGGHPGRLGLPLRAAAVGEPGAQRLRRLRRGLASRQRRRRGRRRRCSATAGGKVRHDFRGKLSYSWPKRPDQTPLNRGDPGYDPLFAYGYGLTYGEPGDLAPLSEDRPAGEDLPEGVLFTRGALPQGWRWQAEAPDGLPAPIVAAVDRTAQEDARRFAWPGGGEGTVSIVPAAPIDLAREATGELSLLVDYRVDSPPTEAVSLWMACGDNCGGTVPVAGLLRSAPAGEWRTLVVPLRCFVRAGLDPKALRTPFGLTTGGRLTLSVSGVRVASAVVDQNECGAP